MSVGSIQSKNVDPRTLSSVEHQAWTRPADWLSLPSVSPTENKVVALLGITEFGGNYVSLNCSAVGGYTVDWGDGTSDNVNSAAQANHLYDYSAISSDTLTSRGFKQVIVTITPQTGNPFSIINLNVRHSALTSIANVPYFDMTISAPSATNITIGALTPNISMENLEQVTMLSHNLTSFANLFQNLRGLQSVPLFDLYKASPVSAANMFDGCRKLQKIPAFDWSRINSFSSTFANCSLLRNVPTINAASATTLANMFNGCASLKTVNVVNVPNTMTASNSMFGNCASLEKAPSFNMAGNLTVASMFFNCRSLKSIPDYNTAAVTNMSQYLQGCVSLERIKLVTTNVTNMDRALTECSALVTSEFNDTSKVTNMTGLFNNCYALKSIGTFSTAALTVANSNTSGGMFKNCYAIQEIPSLDCSRLTTLTGMFTACYNLEKIGDLNTPATLTVAGDFGGGAFQDCRALREIGAMNFSGVTSSNFSNTFATCYSLEKIGCTGMNQTFTVAGCKLGPTALNTIYTNLSATGAGKTITVSNNWGTTADDPTIATAKGWTVTG